MTQISENFRQFPVAENSLNEKQLAAVDFIASGKGYTETARLLNVCPRTIYNWRQFDEFNEAVESRRRELWGRVSDRIRNLLNPALDVLESQLTDKYDRSRYRAANAILRLANLRKTVPIE